MRNCDKEPIIIENDYFFRLTISNKIMCVLIFLSFVLPNLTPELDPHKEMMRRASLTLGIFGISFSWRSMDSNLKSIYCIGLNRALLRCRIINC